MMWNSGEINKWQMNIIRLRFKHNQPGLMSKWIDWSFTRWRSSLTAVNVRLQCFCRHSGALFRSLPLSMKAMVPGQSSAMAGSCYCHTAAIVDFKATGRAVYTPTMVNRQMALLCGRHKSKAVKWPCGCGAAVNSLLWYIWISYIKNIIIKAHCSCCPALYRRVREAATRTN